MWKERSLLRLCVQGAIEREREREEEPAKSKEKDLLAEINQSCFLLLPLHCVLYCRWMYPSILTGELAKGLMLNPPTRYYTLHHHSWTSRRGKQVFGQRKRSGREMLSSDSNSSNLQQTHVAGSLDWAQMYIIGMNRRYVYDVLQNTAARTHCTPKVKTLTYVPLLFKKENLMCSYCNNVFSAGISFAPRWQARKVAPWICYVAAFLFSV